MLGAGGCQPPCTGQRGYVLKVSSAGIDRALSGIGNTPLHIAVCSQAADAEALVMSLLRGSVDVNARNNLSVSPLDLASTDKVHVRSLSTPAPIAIAN